MKKILLFALVLGGAVWYSCSNDFEIAAPWKDIPVVYGLLNIQDQVHYVRVEKAFLDPDANALDLAKIPDSLYYDNAIVQLERVSNGKLFTLEKVDGNLVGLPREDGVFATTPNWLYKIDSSVIQFKPGESIRLHIDRGNGLPDVTAETLMLDKGRQRTPNSFDGKFRFDYILNSKVSWSSDAEAKIFDVKLVINYAEYLASDPASLQDKQIEWVWARGKRNDFTAAEISLEKKGLDFYLLLQNNIPADANMKRIFKGIDIVIVAGGTALEKYINVALSNTGITGSQEIPIFTNLSEGRGVFSSINYLVTKNVGITNESRDSLKAGIHTKLLNFQ